MINNEILAIKDKFVESLHPEKIILFGSYAKDTYNENSDYDFYVIMPDSTPNILHATQEAYICLLDMERKPVDIVVNTVSKFEERSKRATLERTVQNEGVVLYA
ncbi:MAG: nucleotidyltransferase domain-containing protein [Spirochaetaceae bacterium]|nr:nucleotidyltransferase domain-containing protein [Spirochaetaceae bacterium]